MATPRKHWFRVPDSIADEGWPDEILATLIRLQAKMNTRWARNGLSAEEASTIRLSRVDTCAVSGRARFRAGSELVRRVTQYVSASCTIDARGVQFTWPKWPEFQGLTKPSLPESRPRVTRELPESRPLRDAPSPAPSDAYVQYVPSDAESPTASAPGDGDIAHDPKPRKAPREEPKAWALRCSEVMIDLLRPVPGAQIPTGAGKRWAREIERLARDSPELADQADPSAQVEAGIRYALGPRNVGCEFEVVVRSGKALREKWPQLVARARRERAKSKAQSFEGFAERIARGMT